MTPYEFSVGFDTLVQHCGRKFPPAVKDSWGDAFKTLPARPWAKAIDEWVENNYRMPTIREIKALLFKFQTPTDLGEVPDIPLSPQEEDFNRLQVPALRLWLSGNITRDAYLTHMRINAQRAGVFHRIDWDAFGDDVPWNTERTKQLPGPVNVDGADYYPADAEVIDLKEEPA